MTGRAVAITTSLLLGRGAHLGDLLDALAWRYGDRPALETDASPPSGSSRRAPPPSTGSRLQP